MKVKISSIIITLFIPLIFSMPTIYGNEIQIDSINQRYILPFSYDNGKADLGFIMVYSTEATGMPDQHNGVIFNANITFSGSTIFILMHIPLIFKIDKLDTNQPIYLNMDFFFGRSDYQSQLDQYVLIGFAREINWELKI